MTHTSSIDWTAAGELEVLTFDLQGETFALEAVIVREILDMMTATIVPGAPALVGDVVNFRGKIIPLADLRLAFGMTAAESTIDSRIIVIEIDIDGEAVMLGLRTDKVHEVATFTVDTSEAAPVVGMRWRRDYVRSLVRRDSDIVVLPDLQAIFADRTGAPEHTSAAIHSIH